MNRTEVFPDIDPDTARPLELFCPACGALIEASGMADLISRSREHTLDAHNYDIPASHVMQAVRAQAGDTEQHR